MCDERTHVNYLGAGGAYLQLSGLLFWRSHGYSQIVTEDYLRFLRRHFSSRTFYIDARCMPILGF